MIIRKNQSFAKQSYRFSSLSLLLNQLHTPHSSPLLYKKGTTKKEKAGDTARISDFCFAYFILSKEVQPSSFSPVNFMVAFTMKELMFEVPSTAMSCPVLVKFRTICGMAIEIPASA